MAQRRNLDATQLKAFSKAAAGHDGVQTDESGELLIKPCTPAELDFYQQSASSHPDFAELMPTFMGTLQLGASAQIKDATTAHESAELTQEAKDQQLLYGVKIATETAIVLENLEHGFKHPSVLDLKLGVRLYDPNKTAPEKAARLDKVSAETTSGSLNFRVAGMKVWNGESDDAYDKFYGRRFNAENVGDAFGTFFASLKAPGVRQEDAQLILETILAEITKARHILEKSDSRMYSASVLIVYEGDTDALDALMGGQPKTPRADEKAPTLGEVKKSEEEEDEEDGEGPTAFKVKIIDFAHAAWTPGKGPDENVIKGLRNIEDQMDKLIARFQ